MAKWNDEVEIRLKNFLFVYYIHRKKGKKMWENGGYWTKIITDKYWGGTKLYKLFYKYVIKPIYGECKVKFSSPVSIIPEDIKKWWINNIEILQGGKNDK